MSRGQYYVLPMVSFTSAEPVARAIGRLANRMELTVWGGWYEVNDNLSENGAPLTVPCQSQWTVNRRPSPYRHDAQHISQLRLP